MNHLVKTIGVCTFARSEYGSILPVLWEITADSTLELQLIVGGAHLTSTQYRANRKDGISDQRAGSNFCSAPIRRGH